MPAPLVLTRPWPEDAPAIAEALSDWQVVRWLTAVPWPYRPADAAAFIDDAGRDEYAVRQGARLLLGGMVPEGPGAYYPPTVLSGVAPGMTAFDDEIFGPVAAIIEARDE